MIRELNIYLFTRMVLNLSDSEIEEQFANNTTKVTYLQKGKEIGVAIKKGDCIVKHWQILSAPSFRKVGFAYDVWNEDREVVS